MKALVVALMLLCGARAFAEDIPDYDPNSRAWNGLASFAATAEGAGYEVVPVAALQWGELDRGDILVLIYPMQRVDPQRLASFLEAGGSAMIADDFGEAKDALARLGFVRAEVGEAKSDTYWDQRVYAPIASNIAQHPITDGVDHVVTNHPAVLTRVEGATAVVSFDSGQAIVVAGERGPGRFAVVSDPSIFINRMLQFPGNLRLSTNLLKWLGRGHAKRVVLLRGDVPMYGDPKPFIDDAGAGSLGRAMGDINRWLDERNEWLLTGPAMRMVAGILAVVLIIAALFAMPLWRKGAVDGAWLRFTRPEPADEPGRAIALVDGGDANLRVAAAVLRDSVAAAIAHAINVKDPLYGMSKAELVSAVHDARGPKAAEAFARMYSRLRELPSRSQAAAPYGGAHVSRYEFDRLYEEARALYRTLGEELEP
ncbi:MAG TPA: DUF4350 domain-containing protein [Kofleriaceae bacterium]|nr:DUF4350 domain-containing protein [Kofleriaceae bacterium]